MLETQSQRKKPTWFNCSLIVDFEHSPIKFDWPEGRQGRDQQKGKGLGPATVVALLHSLPLGVSSKCLLGASLSGVRRI